MECSPPPQKKKKKKKKKKYTVFPQWNGLLIALYSISYSSPVLALLVFSSGCPAFMASVPLLTDVAHPLL